MDHQRGPVASGDECRSSVIPKAIGRPELMRSPWLAQWSRGAERKLSAFHLRQKVYRIDGPNYQIEPSIAIEVPGARIGESEGQFLALGAFDFK